MLECRKKIDKQFDSFINYITKKEIVPERRSSITITGNYLEKLPKRDLEKNESSGLMDDMKLGPSYLTLMQKRKSMIDIMELQETSKSEKITKITSTENIRRNSLCQIKDDFLRGKDLNMGSIRFYIEFDKSNSKLVINLTEALIVPTLDINGEYNPYIIILLNPGNFQPTQTKVFSHTINPQ